jgi:hypothetical protein
MKAQTSFTLDPSTVAMRLGMCAAAVAGTAGIATDANAVVVSFSTPINVPATTAGVYINLLTGATGTSSAAVPGWDFNPYLANFGAQLGFYWGQTPAGTSGGVATATSGPYLSLPQGATISGTSVFSQAILGTTVSPFITTGTHVLGFRFFNESTSATNYGYLTMTNTAATGFPTMITGWKFENSGAAITIPVTVVPEAPTSLMLMAGALALGAANLRKLRRQRRQQAH